MPLWINIALVIITGLLTVYAFVLLIIAQKNYSEIVRKNREKYGDSAGHEQSDNGKDQSQASNSSGNASSE